MMPILDPGQTNPAGAAGARRSAGFTLVEALVVLCIVGILATAAGLGAVADSSLRKLQYDARRLAHLFVIAQNDARAWGHQVQWRVTAEGYRFERLNRSVHRSTTALPTHTVQSAPPVEHSLRPRHWHSDSAVQVAIQPNTPAVFSGDWLSGPERVQLSNGRDTVSIVRAALGTYRVVP